MFKVCLVLALTVSAVLAQEASQPEAAPEPYSYGYSTDTHAAQEQRDPSGRVTGSYQLVGDDGRERRVEYVADENGYRAKIVTNEVGTKSENPADVELLANEPTPAQYTQQVQYVQQPQPQVQYVRQQVQQVQPQLVAQRVSTVQQPAAYRQVTYKQTAVPAQGAAYGYGYYPGSGYALNSGYYGQGYGQGYGLGYGQGYNSLGYGYASSPAYTRTTTTSTGGLINVGNYNNHLPSQYYSSIGQVSGAQVVPAGASYSTQGVRYQPAGVTTSSVRTVGVPSGYSTVGSTSNLAGSSNYIVLQKRAAAAEENKAKSS